MEGRGAEWFGSIHQFVLDGVIGYFRVVLHPRLPPVGPKRGTGHFQSVGRLFFVRIRHLLRVALRGDPGEAAAGALLVGLQSLSPESRLHREYPDPLSPSKPVAAGCVAQSVRVIHWHFLPIATYLNT